MQRNIKTSKKNPARQPALKIKTKSRDIFSPFFASDKLSLLTDLLDEKTRTRLAATSKRLNTHSRRTTENDIWKELKLLTLSKDLQQYQSDITPSISFPDEAAVNAIIAQQIPTAAKIETLVRDLITPMQVYLDRQILEVKDHSIEQLPAAIKTVMHSKILQRTLLPLKNSFERWQELILKHADNFLLALDANTYPELRVAENLHDYFYLGLTPYSNYSMISLFARAIMSGNMDAVAFCLTSGAQVNQMGKDDGTSLMVAAQSGHVHITRLLLEHKADPNQTAASFMEPPVNTATKKGDVTTVRLLVNAKADVNHHFLHRTPLDDACEINQTKMLAVLLTSDTLKKNTLTRAMKTAVLHQRYLMIRMLKQAGADCGPGINKAKKYIARFMDYKKTMDNKIAALHTIIEFLQAEKIRMQNKKKPSQKSMHTTPPRAIQEPELCHQQQMMCEAKHESPAALPHTVLFYLLDFLDDKTRLRFAVTSKALNSLAKTSVENYVWQELQSIAFSPELQRQRRGFYRFAPPRAYFPGTTQIKAIIAQPIPGAFKTEQLADALTSPMKCYFYDNEASLLKPLRELPAPIKKIMSSKLLQKTFSGLARAIANLKKSAAHGVVRFLEDVRDRKSSTDAAAVQQTLQIYFDHGITPAYFYADFSGNYHYRSSLFLISVISGSTAAVSFCINQGFDVNYIGKDDFWGAPSSLAMAAEHGHAHITRLLLAHKADPNLHSSDRWPVITAARLGDLATVKLLVAAKADVNHCRSSDEATNALSEACKKGDRKMLEVLLTSDTLKKPSLNDPMKHSLFKRDYTMMRMLINAGADCAAGIENVQQHIEELRARIKSEDNRPKFQKAIDIMQREEKPVRRKRFTG